MTRLEQALRILEDEFEVFVVVGSMYNPLDGTTTSSKIYRGNAYAVEGMIGELTDSMYGIGIPREGGDE